MRFLTRRKKQPLAEVLAAQVGYAVMRVGQYHGRLAAYNVLMTIATELCDQDSPEAQALDACHKRQKGTT